MNDSIKELKSLFIKITRKGWIKNMSNGYGSVGQTFEYLIGNEINNFELPDYNGIEIKVKKSLSKAHINLFSSAPDGKHLFPIKTIRDKYGYKSSKFKNVKIFNVSLYSNKVISVGSNFLIKLKVDRKEEKIYFFVIDINFNLVDDEIYWSFDTLKEKLFRKLKILAVINALVKIENKVEYYKYNKICFYKLKSFDDFINLVDNGTIRITFNIGIFFNGKKAGKTHDHGTSFEIQEEDLIKLYNKIDV
jgi:hypothetical protein